MCAEYHFVPLVVEVFVAEMVLQALLRAAGAYGPANKEHPWLLHAHTLLSVAVFGKVSVPACCVVRRSGVGVACTRTVAAAAATPSGRAPSCAPFRCHPVM